MQSGPPTPSRPGRRRRAAARFTACALLGSVVAQAVAGNWFAAFYAAVAFVLAVLLARLCTLLMMIGWRTVELSEHNAWLSEEHARLEVENLELAILVKGGPGDPPPALAAGRPLIPPGSPCPPAEPETVT